MPKTTQLVLNLESKPGVLAKLARTLADAGVNMTALCAPETAGRGKIRLLVGDPARAKEALKTAKYRFSEEQAVTSRRSWGRHGSTSSARTSPGTAGVNSWSCRWRTPTRHSRRSAHESVPCGLAIRADGALPGSGRPQPRREDVTPTLDNLLSRAESLLTSSCPALRGTAMLLARALGQPFDVLVSHPGDRQG